MEVLALTPEIRAARAAWAYRGQARPDFAEPTGAGEESVWDFPRPPRLETVTTRLRVLAPDGSLLAATEAGRRVVETAGAPTYYFPPQDVEETRLTPTGGRSLCEWKGLAEGLRCGDADPAGWRYTVTFPEFLEIRSWYAFYPGSLRCFIGDEAVRPQPGGYYGGWVYDGLRGPIKGAPGTGSW